MTCKSGGIHALSLTLRLRAGALDRLHGATPLWSLVAMVAFGNQCEPFSIVTPTRANSEGKVTVMHLAPPNTCIMSKCLPVDQ